MKSSQKFQFALASMLCCIPKVGYSANKVLERGQSQIILNCVDVGQDPYLAINKLLVQKKFVVNGVEIESPFHSSAPGLATYSYIDQSHHVMCGSVTITKL